MNKILVPVDFSEHSEYALEVAATLARKQKAEIVVLHMMGLSEAVLTKDDSQEFMELQYYMKMAKKRFDMFFNRPWLKDIKLTQMVLNYKVFSEINNVAKEQDIDLIVMGSHGTGGLSEIFVGSNTEKVVRTSEVPVLVIKKRIPGFKIQKVVFGFDFQIENVPAYLKALQLFRSLKADVHLVHVNLPGINFMSTTEIQAEINKFLRVAHHGDLPNTVQVKQISDYLVERGMYGYAKEIDADLIAIPTHGRSGLAHFFLGSIGEDLVNHANLPVMTFRI
ncbi:MAG TPA: universal stress protein [Pricia sp.]|nr:universal stress protein [Pricia sp.]